MTDDSIFNADVFKKILVEAIGDRGHVIYTSDKYLGSSFQVYNNDEIVISILNFEIKDDGQNVLIPGEKFTYLTFKETPDAIAKVIEDLMMHQPAKK